MKGYLRKLRIVGLAAVVGLALFAIPAAQSGARLVCPPGTHKRIYCKRHIKIKIHITISGATIHVTITVTDPHAKVLLLHNGKVLRQLFNGTVSGTFHVNAPKPTTPGIYEIKVIATAGGVTKTAVKKFRVSASAPPIKKGVGFTG